jgi:HSP20 family protein
LQENDFDITFDKNILSVLGSRTDHSRSVKVFHQMEVNFGEFFTGIEINIPLEIDNAEAKYNNGFLYIYINKASPKIIKIGK